MMSILGARLAVKLKLCPAQCRILNRILHQNFHIAYKDEQLVIERHLHCCTNSNYCHKSATRTDPHTASSRLVPPRCLHVLQRAAKHSLAGMNYDEAAEGNGESFKEPVPDFDWDYLCNLDNSAAIRENIKSRKGVGNIDELLSLWKKIQQLMEKKESQQEDVQPVSDRSPPWTSQTIIQVDLSQEEELELLRQKLYKAAADIPNTTHPDVPIGDESQAHVVETCGQKREFNFKPKTIIDLTSQLDILRTENTGHTTGPRTYYFKGPLVQMEQALIKYTVSTLCKKGFVLMSVPDLIHPSIIEGCGFSTTGERTQVYKLEPSKHGEICLAGTGEMPLAGYFTNKVFTQQELPQRVMTVSRCFRAETSSVEEERGIYRVHQFTKVEMFVVTANDTGHESDDLVEELRSIERDLFSRLGIHFRVLDMPSQELGAPACRKYDMETWMPAKQFWGEISSTSNCTDFQSRRLNIKYRQSDGQVKHAHTVNDTACAVPRILMTLIENGQNEDGSICVPEALQPYMNGRRVIEKPDQPLILQWSKLTNATRRQGNQS